MIHSMMIESESKDWSGLYKLSVIVNKHQYEFITNNKYMIDRVKKFINRKFYGKAMNLLKSISVK
jgi:hypothetical protein